VAAQNFPREPDCAALTAMSSLQVRVRSLV
jgi:hypothetical protein